MLALIIFIGANSSQALPLLNIETPYYDDVSADAEYFHAVQWATEQKITNGTGNNKFSPDIEIPIYQIATMLCRAENKKTSRPADTAYQCGWLTMEEVTMPDTKCTKASAIEILFNFKNIPYYDSVFYTGETLSKRDNFLKLANDLGITNDKENNYVTRGEFINMLYKVCVNDYALEIKDPEVFPITYNGTGSLNEYYKQLAKIPEAIRTRFINDGWKLEVNYDYLGNLTEKYHKSVTGATVSSDSAIYVNTPHSVIHEFGHYLDYVLGTPSNKDIFTAERQSAQVFLRSYANTNNSEYFAEYFDCFLRAQSSERLKNQLQELTPETYNYFSSLADNNWIF